MTVFGDVEPQLQQIRLVCKEQAVALTRATGGGGGAGFGAGGMGGFGEGGAEDPSVRLLRGVSVLGEGGTGLASVFAHGFHGTRLFLCRALAALGRTRRVELAAQGVVRVGSGARADCRPSRRSRRLRRPTTSRRPRRCRWLRPRPPRLRLLLHLLPRLRLHLLPRLRLRPRPLRRRPSRRRCLRARRFRRRRAATRRRRTPTSRRSRDPVGIRRPARAAPGTRGLSPPEEAALAAAAALAVVRRREGVRVRTGPRRACPVDGRPKSCVPRRTPPRPSARCGYVPERRGFLEEGFVSARQGSVPGSRRARAPASPRSLPPTLLSVVSASALHGAARGRLLVGPLSARRGFMVVLPVGRSLAVERCGAGQDVPAERARDAGAPAMKTHDRDNGDRRAGDARECRRGRGRRARDGGRARRRRSRAMGRVCGASASDVWATPPCGLRQVRTASDARAGAATARARFPCALALGAARVSMRRSTRTTLPRSPGRGAAPTMSRLRNPWTSEEDAKLLEFVRSHEPTTEGPDGLEVDWREASQRIPGRTPKQCRERCVVAGLARMGARAARVCGPDTAHGIPASARGTREGKLGRPAARACAPRTARGGLESLLPSPPKPARSLFASAARPPAQLAQQRRPGHQPRPVDPRGGAPRRRAAPTAREPLARNRRPPPRPVRRAARSPQAQPPPRAPTRSPWESAARAPARPDPPRVR